MSNNTTLNAGSGGDTIATNDVAGVKYQIVKLDVGALGATAALSNSNPLPISDAAGSLTVDGTVGVSGTVHVDDNSSTLSIDDGGGSLTVDGTVAVSGTVTVDSELTTADLDTGAGTDTRAVVGLVLAASGGGVLAGTANPVPISDNAGSLTVDGTVSITANSAVNVAQVGGTNADTNSGTKSAGTLRVVLATDQPALTNKLLVTPDSVALPANQSVNVSQINAVTPLMGNGVTGTGSLRVTIASDTTSNSNAYLVKDAPVTSGGLSFSSFVGANSNNKTAIKASAGQLYMISVQNLASTPVYLKVFDKTSANVTAGTTACDYQFMIPGNTAGAGIVLNVDKGIAHANAITVMLTAAIGTTDNTSVSANNQVVTLGYK